METPETYEEAKARRRQRTIVIVIAVIALCCVCLVVAIAIYSWSAVRGGQTQEFPSERRLQSDTFAFSVSTSNSPGDPSEVGCSALSGLSGHCPAFRTLNGH